MAPRFFRRTGSSAIRKRKPVYKKRTTTSTPRRMVKGSARAGYRALRAVSNLQRKLDIHPRQFIMNLSNHYTYKNGDGVLTSPMTTISTATPWILPLTWFYEVTGCSNNQTSMRTFHQNATTNVLHKMAFMNLRMRFRIANDNIIRNDTVRFMIVYDKLPQRETPLWVQPPTDTTTTDDDVRGLFIQNTIDSARFPGSHQRFRVLYDKTIFMNATTKPTHTFLYNNKKAYKVIRSIETNAYDPIETATLDNTYANWSDIVTYDTTNNVPLGCPLTKGAIYCMIFTELRPYTLDTDAFGMASDQFSFNYRLGIYDM